MNVNITPEMLSLAAENLCVLRGVDPKEAPNPDDSTTFHQMAHAEIVSAIQCQTALQMAVKGLDVHGKPKRPVILNANGGRLN